MLLGAIFLYDLEFWAWVEEQLCKGLLQRTASIAVNSSGWSLFSGGS